MSGNQNQEMQRLYYMYQQFEEQIKDINEKISYLESSKIGFSITKSTIEEIKKTEANQEIILPIGNSAFVKAKIVDPNNYLISIGKDVMAERTADQAMDFIEKSQENQEKVKNMLQEQAQKLTTEINKIRPQLEAMSQQASMSKANLNIQGRESILK